jgi:hypothetical protein
VIVETTSPIAKAPLTLAMGRNCVQPAHSRSGVFTRPVPAMRSSGQSGPRRADLQGVAEAGEPVVHARWRRPTRTCARDQAVTRSSRGRDLVTGQPHRRRLHRPWPAPPRPSAPAGSVCPSRSGSPTCLKGVGLPPVRALGVPPARRAWGSAGRKSSYGTFVGFRPVRRWGRLPVRAKPGTWGSVPEANVACWGTSRGRSRRRAL